MVAPSSLREHPCCLAQERLLATRILKDGACTWCRTRGKLHLKIFVTNVPRGPRNSVASRSASSTSADCEYASLAHTPPTLGAPSWITVSAIAPPSVFFKSCQVHDCR